MAKKRRAMELQRETCCICHRICGCSQPELRKLQNGDWAEELCINKKFFKEVVYPVRTQFPDIRLLSWCNPPEKVIDALVDELMERPIKRCRTHMRKIIKFAKTILGYEIDLASSLLRLKR